MDGNTPRSTRNIPHSMESSSDHRVNEIKRELDYYHGKLTNTRELQYVLFQKEKYYKKQITHLEAELRLLGFGQQMLNLTEDDDDTGTDAARTPCDEEEDC